VDSDGGLQGAGKTTSVQKAGPFLKKDKRTIDPWSRHVLTVYRPAANRTV